MSVLASAPTGGPTGLGAGSAGLRHTASTTNGNGGNGHGNVSVSAEASEALNIVGHFVRDCVAHGVRTQVRGWVGWYGWGLRVWGLGRVRTPSI